MSVLASNCTSGQLASRTGKSGVTCIKENLDITRKTRLQNNVPMDTTRNMSQLQRYYTKQGATKNLFSWCKIVNDDTSSYLTMTKKLQLEHYNSQ
jgi:hypothetical protein